MIWKTWFSSKSWIFIKFTNQISFLPKTKMVRMVHTNHFYEISLQISEPKIEFSTKTHFWNNGHVQNFGKCSFWWEKSPCGVVPQQNKGCKHIPEHSRPNSDQIKSKNHCFYSNFMDIGDFQLKLLNKLRLLLRKLSYE